MESNNKLLTLMQAAELSACSIKTLRRAIEAGRLAVTRLGQSAKSDRIHVDDLEKWWRQSQYVAPPMPVFPDRIKVPIFSGADERLERLLATNRTKAANKPRPGRKAQ
ncbi:excisionase family DNA-binding protein [Stenotrophomonas maltophilia]|uniref:excisionase family DNA-binding protein n=1 Tax=Stenotrophomonas maltophilia TaxID=40324 RepID=UPI0011B07C33|nr:excisionase family DNA-binding protein [Stenotrophomonas maltophilia]MBN5037251.1 excisionase family DNA-binding protein [Stenotrophomonas maltophilia]MBN5053836.1 excisionase family DNA-binding protein [Stenotrophomonas maltophilia]HEL5329123.1 excisionase family DNA-binding protein [Stenotrophomonas maltophilia]